MKILIILSLSALFMLFSGCKKDAGAGKTEGQTSSAQIKEVNFSFEDNYVCQETGLTYKESKEGKLECKSGDELAEVVELMKKNGFSNEKIMEKFQYFSKGRRIVEIIQNSTICQDGNKVKLDFFIMSHCPYGVRFMVQVFPEIIKNMGTHIDWTPYFIFNREQNGKLGALHGDEEVLEGLRGICMREKNGKDAWLKYFNCFSQSQLLQQPFDYKKCSKEAGINHIQTDACVKNEANKLAEKDLSLVEKYGAGASPTAVYNCNRKIVGAIPFNYTRGALCSFFTGEKPAVCNK